MECNGAYISNNQVLGLLNENHLLDVAHFLLTCRLYQLNYAEHFLHRGGLNLQMSLGPSSFPSSDRSSLGLPGPLFSGSLSPEGFWSFFKQLEAVWELWITTGTVVDMCPPNVIPELVPAFLEFRAV